MAAPVILIETTPRSAIDGSAVPVLLAGGGADVPYHYGNRHWRAGINGLPKVTATLDFDGEQLGGGGTAQALELVWSPGSSAAVTELAALFWTDAPITIYVGPEGDAMPPVSTTGLVLETSVQADGLHIALADQTTDLKRAVLVDRFAGTGGIEGPPAIASQIKPRAWGRCFNVVGRVLDAANNIWCFGDPARPWQSFDQVRDKGAAPSAASLSLLAWQGSIAATFAALQGAQATAGGGVLCPSIACVKWWAQPAGDLHADIRGETAGGYVETAPEIASRIVPVRSTLGFAAGEIAAAAAARPAACGVYVDSDSTTAADIVSDLLAGVSLSWMIAGGAIVFRRWEWTASTRVATSHRVTRSKTIKPVTARKLGYRRNWAPMARGDLAGIVLVQDVVYDTGMPVTTAIAAAATTATWPGVSDTTGTKPADNATVGATIGTDLKAADGHVLFPAEVLNSALVLAPDGTLSAAIAGIPTVLGKVKLPDLGAATDASRRQLEADLASLSAAVAQLTTGQAIVQNVFRDAGLFTDRASGLTKLYAIESRAQQITSLSVSLNAALGTIGLKADVNYVNQAILTAQLGGSSADLSSLLVRLSSAEANINGLQATVQLKADATVVTGLQGTVTAVQQSLDALNATVVTKASQTQVDAQGQRLTIAEQTLSAFDGASIAQTVTASRRAPADADSAGTTAILDLLNGAASTQLALTGIAQARQELGARVSGAFDAVASLSLQLAVQIGAVTAAAASETAARVGADQASAATLAAYQTSIAGNLAGINTAIGTVSTKTDATAQSLSDFQANTAQNLAGINQKLTATTGEADATAAAVTALQASTAQGFASANQTFAAQSGVNGSLAGRIDTVSTKVEANTNTLTQYGQSINGLGSKWGVEINANGVITGIALNNASGRTDLVFVVNGFKIAQPDGSGARTVFNITDAGVVQMRGVQVDSLTVGSVGFDQLLLGAAQKCAFYSTTDDLSIGQNQTGTVATVTFMKEDASSVLKLVLFGNCYSPDDLQFVGNIMLDGNSVQSARVNIVLDTQTSQGEMPITPFKFLSGVAAGQHTVSFTMQNTNVKNLALTVRAGATLEVTELRKGSIGSATGSGGQIASSPASGGTSGGGGGNAGGTYSGAGQQQ